MSLQSLCSNHYTTLPPILEGTPMGWPIQPLWPEEGVPDTWESLLIYPFWSSPRSALTPLPLPPLSLSAIRPTTHLPEVRLLFHGKSANVPILAWGRDVVLSPLRSLICSPMCPEPCSMPSAALGAGSAAVEKPVGPALGELAFQKCVQFPTA